MLDSVARRFRALGEPQRLRILQMLENVSKNVSDVAEGLGASQPNVSRHLRALFEAGPITRRRSGTSTVYSVLDPLVFKLCGLVCDGLVQRARADLEEIATAGVAPAAQGERRRRRLIPQAADPGSIRLHGGRNEIGAATKGDSK